MMQNLRSGITKFCKYWQDAQTLQETYKSLCREVSSEIDGCIDAAKSIVECACELLISELDDPTDPIKGWTNSPIGTITPTISNLVAAVTLLLKLSDRRNDPLQKVISQHHKLAKELSNFRNVAGTFSHGKDGFSEKLSVHHQKSAVLSADAIILFLHEAYLERPLDPVHSFESFERFADQSTAINGHCAFLAAGIEEDDLRATITLPQGDAIELFVHPSELLFFVDRIAYKTACYASADSANDKRVDDARATS